MLPTEEEYLILGKFVYWTWFVVFWAWGIFMFSQIIWGWFKK